MTTNGGLKTLNNDTKSDINNNNNTLNSSHVDFSPDVGVEVDFTPRDSQRYLTAKYPKQQMGMIRRRLAVEDWMDGQMSTFCEEDKQPYAEFECPIDLDELMDIEDTQGKIDYVKEKTSHLSTPSSIIKAFTEDLIKKMEDL